MAASILVGHTAEAEIAIESVETGRFVKGIELESNRLGEGTM